MFNTIVCKDNYIFKYGANQSRNITFLRPDFSHILQKPKDVISTEAERNGDLSEAKAFAKANKSF